MTNVDMTPLVWWIAPVASVLALGFAAMFGRMMLDAPEGNARMREIAGYVREGAMAYLFRQYRVVGRVFLVLFVVLALLAFFGIQNPFVPLAFLTGGFFSGLCGYIGMRTATAASSRTAQGASVSLNKGLQVAFRSGAVMGLVVVGFGLLDICIWYWVLDKWVYTPSRMLAGWSMGRLVFVPENCTAMEKIVHMTTTMITFGMGASTQALFARVGGGIYTKAADVGADLVGKVEAGIPEDDPRNPATIADNVGDNVGDVAGMGADLYESYCGSILATAALGAAVGMHHVTRAWSSAAEPFDSLGEALASGHAGTVAAMKEAVGLVVAPMMVAGIGTLLSIVGIFMVRTQENATQKTLLRALLTGTLGSSFLIVLALLALAGTGLVPWGIVFSVMAGLAAGVVIGQATEYYTSDEYAPTRGIAGQSRMGPATTIMDGLATGMYSAGISVVTIVIGILCAFGFAGGFHQIDMGLYGIGFAAVGMLSTLGITLATDAYGPIADNAGGNAEMAGLPAVVRERTDALDALGNTTAATGKGFAIGSAVLTAMALLAAYIEEIKIWAGRMKDDPHIQAIMGAEFTADPVQWLKHAEIKEFVQAFEMHLMNPLLLCGLFIGAMMAFVFCAMTLKAVGRAAGAMVEEVRRQFRDIPGIMDGRGKPDYARCVEISTAGAQREMLAPSLLAITAPVLTGLVLGVPGVMGLLTGGLATGFVLATMLNNAGGAWDNAKKYIEKGNLGGKYLRNVKGEYVDAHGNPVAEDARVKNPVHGAAVIGDTVGDPCKDTSGPALNILIKLMTMVSVVFTPVVLKFSPMIQDILGISTR